jgi:hypothetical protein
MLSRLKFLGRGIETPPGLNTVEAPLFPCRHMTTPWPGCSLSSISFTSALRVGRRLADNFGSERIDYAASIRVVTHVPLFGACLPVGIAPVFFAL